MDFFDFIVNDSDQYFKVKIRQWSTQPEKVTFTIWIMDRTHRLRKRTELNRTLNAPTQTYQAQPIRIQNPRPDVPLEIDQLPINPNEIIYLGHPHRWASNISGSSTFWAVLENYFNNKIQNLHTPVSLFSTPNQLNQTPTYQSLHHTSYPPGPGKYIKFDLFWHC